ncbi:MAG: hypothetical protein HYS17_06580 [Micavibrio aeruginosavorus]|uniref:Uncharacterized protein n=1 Tax=Micavibrio aeruginosavorus TaxID=349221 RepID=A0A7T5UGD7_9BACT|nr:MAG: hypothetical protein HYS17_06580 [Micavibrio aeruginosavorus]
MATPAACAAETARARSQPLRQLQEAYHIVIGTRFGGWLFEHSEALVFAPPDTIIKEGFAPYSSAMKRARDILIGIEISDLFKQAIADAAWTSYRAVFADMKVRKALMDWPKNQPSWEDVKSLAEHAEAVIAETYVLAGHKTHARPIVPQKDPARNGTVTLASTSGDAIFINMHPDAWLLTSTPRTPTSIIGDMFHEHHHCLQRDLIKAHRSGAISR